MSVMYPQVASLAAFIGTAVQLHQSGIQKPIAFVVAAAVGLVAAAGWVYSPLPNHNRGFFAPEDDGSGYWGFTRAPDAEEERETA